MRAAQKGDDAKVKRLLKLKDIESKEVALALAQACRFGHVGAVRLLLKTNVTAELQGSRGVAGLTAASYDGHLDCVRLMLEAKALPTTIALVGAAGQGHAPRCVWEEELELAARLARNFRRARRRRARA